MPRKVRRTRPKVRRVAKSPRPEADLVTQAKQAASQALDVAVNDPDRFVDFFKNLAQGGNLAYEFFKKNPVEAKKAIRNAAISAAAKVAKSRLT